MRRDYPSAILTVAGVLVIGIGVYFVLFRPALLPEEFTGLVSIGLMSAVNVIIDSDFKWFVAAVAFLWLLAVAMRTLGAGALAKIPGDKSQIRP